MAAASIAQSWRRLAAGEASCTSGRSTICATDSSSCVLAQKSGGTTTDIRWHGARADGMQLAITDIQSWARVEQEDPLEGDRPLRGNEPQTKKGGYQPGCRCGFQERQQTAGVVAVGVCKESVPCTFTG
jgi:hypothetical protein